MTLLAGTMKCLGKLFLLNSPGQQALGQTMRCDGDREAGASALAGLGAVSVREISHLSLIDRHSEEMCPFTFSLSVCWLLTSFPIMNVIYNHHRKLG